MNVRGCASNTYAFVRDFGFELLKNFSRARYTQFMRSLRSLCVIRAQLLRNSYAVLRDTCVVFFAI